MILYSIQSFHSKTGYKKGNILFCDTIYSIYLQQLEMIGKGGGGNGAGFIFAGIHGVAGVLYRP